MQTKTGVAEVAKGLGALTANFNNCSALFNELKVMAEPDERGREELKSYRDVACGFSPPSSNHQITFCFLYH